MLGVGTLRDPRFTKKRGIFSFLCQMLLGMVDQDTQKYIFQKNKIFQDTIRKLRFQNYSVNKDITRKCKKSTNFENANKNAIYLAMRGSPPGPIESHDIQAREGPLFHHHLFFEKEYTETKIEPLQ